MALEIRRSFDFQLNALSNQSLLRRLPLQVEKDINNNYSIATIFMTHISPYAFCQPIRYDTDMYRSVGSEGGFQMIPEEAVLPRRS
jgi:hypothetical protein